LKKENIPFKDLRTSLPGMEEAFISMMKGMDN
jgi:hypothetical protein